MAGAINTTANSKRFFMLARRKVILSLIDCLLRMPYNSGIKRHMISLGRINVMRPVTSPSATNESAVGRLYNLIVSNMVSA